MRHELESLAASLLPLGAYSFPGRSKDLPYKITNAAMFVLSSDYEGMPNVVIEAMALGTPVISTNCPSGGPEYLIQSGENGLLVPVGDVGSLVDAMCELAVNEAYAKKISKNAMRIRKTLNSNLVAEHWLKYLSGVGGFTT